jgi:hypothetical protein
MGKGVYRLALPEDLSRISPVFHTSLLLPFIDPKQFPNRLGSKAPRGPAALSPGFNFWDEKDVEAIIGYHLLTCPCWTPEYLVRWRGGSTADDSWVKRGNVLSELASVS